MLTLLLVLTSFFFDAKKDVGLLRFLKISTTVAAPVVETPGLGELLLL